MTDATVSTITGLAVYEPKASLIPAIDADRVAAMQDDLESIKIVFPKVKIPSGGVGVWTLPGDANFQPTIEGVIIDHHAANAYWAGQFGGTGKPPDCTAIDGKRGVGDPGVLCRTCDFNQWGSGVDQQGNPTRGKACKNMRRLYVMVPGQSMPWLIVLSPGSLKNFEEYIQNMLLPRGLGARHVVTSIGLRKEKNPGNIEYSQATFRCVGSLSPDHVKMIDQYAAQMRPQTRGGAIGADDLDG